MNAIISENKSRQPKRASQMAFLASYSTCGNVSRAADDAGVNRALHYQWLKETSQSGDRYRLDFENARQQAADTLVAEARRRGVDGVRKLVHHIGKPVFVFLDAESGEVVPPAHETVGTDDDGNPITIEVAPPGAVRKPLYEHSYSDALLIVLMKAARPEEFRERYEHTGANGGPIRTSGELSIHDILSDPDSSAAIHALLGAATRKPGRAGDAPEQGPMAPGAA